MIQKCVLLLPLTFFYLLIKKKKKKISNTVQITHFLASLSPCSYDINSSKSLMIQKHVLLVSFTSKSPPATIKFQFLFACFLTFLYYCCRTVVENCLTN